MILYIERNAEGRLSRMAFVHGERQLDFLWREFIGTRRLIRDLFIGSK